jgi:hypothetical protein
VAFDICNIIVSLNHHLGNLSSIDAPPSSLMDSIASPKMKIVEGEGIGVRSLVRNPSGVEGPVGAPGWGLGRLTRKSITHMDLHKPNKKLVIM